MFNRSQIMSRAWEIIRDSHTFAGHFHKPGSYTEVLSSSLKQAWAEAKERARIEAIPAERRDREVARIVNRIRNLDYKPLQHNIARERAALERQLSALSA